WPTLCPPVVTKRTASSLNSRVKCRRIGFTDTSRPEHVPSLFWCPLNQGKSIQDAHNAEPGLSARGYCRRPNVLTLSATRTAAPQRPTGHPPRAPSAPPAAPRRE